MYSFKYNRVDATLYNILFSVSALHVSGGLSAHRQELKNCTHSIWYVPGLLAATASVVELEFGRSLRPSSGAQALYTQHLVCAYRALTVIKNNV